MNKTETSIYDSGVLEEGKEAILQFKETHKKKRKADYQKGYRKKMNRVELQLTDEELAHISELAKEASKRKPTFIKECVFTFLENRLLLPNDPQLQEIIVLLRRYGNLFNQVIRYCHLDKDVRLEQLQEIFQKLQELENLILEQLQIIPNQKP